MSGLMLAQRGTPEVLVRYYAPANQMNEWNNAGEIHMNLPPRGWMKTEPDLLIFEQHCIYVNPVTALAMLRVSLYLIADCQKKLKLRNEAEGRNFV